MARYKFFLLLMCGLMVSLLTIASADILDEASEAYRRDDYKKSIELYEKVIAEHLEKGEESPEIYYNLGNAYFRDNQIGKAILNYNRALLLSPGDSDIRHNLRFANTRIEDKIIPSNRFFLADWFESVQNLFNSNTWGVIAIVLFFLFLGCMGVFLFVRILWARKTAFYTGIVIFLLMIAANVFAFNQKNARIYRNSAVIMAPAVSIRTSPDSNSKELFQLHEGATVKIRKIDGDWYEIEIANGSVGWIPKDYIEII
ncbi:MAG: SH3 domain-containing protein [Dysgonamonadaceae bacterium]|jgi:tetratricopeptide (TPR) repeat protein